MASSRRARTQVQKQEYHRLARQMGGEDTENQSRAESLEGSDQTPGVSVNRKPELVDKASFLGWIKSNKHNVIMTFVIAIIASLIVVMIGWFSDLKGQVSYLNLVVSENRAKISELSSAENSKDSITKEYLELKLELVERDLKELIPDTEGISKRLAEIEKQIDLLQDDGSRRQ